MRFGWNSSGNYREGEKKLKYEKITDRSMDGHT